MKNFFLFCCFFIALASTSCKKSNTSSSEETSQSIEITETASTETDSTSKTILFFGDSLTAGYGLEDPDDAFPGLIQDRIDSLGLEYEVINAGLSGETTAGGRNRTCTTGKSNRL